MHDYVKVMGVCLFGEIMVELISIDEFNFIKCKWYFARVLKWDVGRSRSVSSECTLDGGQS